MNNKVPYILHIIHSIINSVLLTEPADDTSGKTLTINTGEEKKEGAGDDTQHKSGLGDHRETLLTLCKYYNDKDFYAEIINKLQGNEQNGGNKLINLKDEPQEVDSSNKSE